MVRLRSATVGDIPILKKWDEDVNVWTSGGEEGPFNWETEIPRRIEWREMLIAEHDGRPIGFIQIIDAADEETHYWGDVSIGAMAIDIWIGNLADRNCGFGTRMMELAADRCFARENTTTIFVDPLESNERACRFYERLGYRYVETRKFDSDICRVYRLDRLE